MTITQEELNSWYKHKSNKEVEIEKEEEYDDGQGRKYDILDSELE